MSPEALLGLECIVEKVEKLGSAKHAKELPEDDQDMITRLLKDTHHHLRMAPHLSAKCMLHDNHHTINAIEDEVCVVFDWC